MVHNLPYLITDFLDFLHLLTHILIFLARLAFNKHIQCAAVNLMYSVHGKGINRAISITNASKLKPDPERYSVGE